MTDYSQMDYSTFSKLLGGGDTRPRQIGSFNQGSFRTDVGQRVTSTGASIHSSIGGKSLGGGYCAGVCVDWARRTLLSTKALDASALTYGYDTIKGGKGTRTGRSLNQSKDRAYQTVQRMGKAWVASNDMQWTAPQGASTYTVESSDWQAMVTKADDAFKAGRQANNRAESKKPFRNLVLLGSKKANYSSPGQWMGALFGSGLKAGAVSKLDFNKPGATGHAVAVWQRKATLTDTDSFYLFDPNYGVFTYTLQQLQVALQYLFWFDDDDTPHYADCSSKTLQRLTWTIFGPLNLVGASSNPVVVQSPPVTPPSQHQPASSVPVPVPSNPPSQAHFAPPQPAPVQPSVVAPPVNPYSIPAFGLSSPGVIATTASPSAGGSELKRLLVQYRDDPSRQIAGAFSSHGTTQGGWVKVPFSLIDKIKKAQLTNSEFIKVGKIGQDEVRAVAREHIDWLIARA